MTVQFICPRRKFIRYGVLVKVTPRYAHIKPPRSERNIRVPIDDVKEYRRKEQ
jgi:hypothetical protein